MTIGLPQIATVAGAATGAWAGSKLLSNHKIIGAVLGGLVVAGIVNGLFAAYSSYDSSGRKSVGLPDPTTGANAVDADSAATAAAGVREDAFMAKQRGVT